MVMLDYTFGSMVEDEENVTVLSMVGVSPKELKGTCSTVMVPEKGPHEYAI
jgi:hypothetical protein